MATNARDRGPLTRAVAEEMRSLLGALNMNQTDLSRATGIPKATVSSILNGKAAIDIEQVEAIADALEVDPSELMRSARVRYRRIIGEQTLDDARAVGPLVTSRGSVTARSTDEDHEHVVEWAKSRRKQVRGLSAPSQDQGSDAT